MTMELLTKLGNFLSTDNASRVRLNPMPPTQIKICTVEVQTLQGFDTVTVLFSQMVYRIKQAHQSFFVINDTHNDTCPYYLKDRKKEVPGRVEGSPAERRRLLSLDEGSSCSHQEPFQKVDISRLRSPNIPYVGSNRNRKLPAVQINQEGIHIVYSQIYLAPKSIYYLPYKQPSYTTIIV